MPRKPKPKNTMTAGERARLYEAEMAEKQRRMHGLDGDVPNLDDDANEASASVATYDASKTAEKIPEKPKKALPKPQSATVKVDFSIETGNIGAMHGMCNGPVSYGADITRLFKEIGVPCVRFDKTDGAQSSCAIDVSRIFRDVNADPNRPESYDFTVTDKYVTAAYNSGAKVIFRLGESRDVIDEQRRSLVPENIDLWSSVCANVIRHYNDYFAHGFAFGIEYFEIWNHDPAAKRDEWATEFELYRRVASVVKIVDADIKVGGMAFDRFDEAAREFVRFCKKTRTPLDFITLRSFDGDPVAVVNDLNEAYAYLKNVGLDSTEVILGEWCYIDGEALGEKRIEAVLPSLSDDNVTIKRAIFNSQSSIKGAAYAAALMLELDARSEVSTACFYDAQPMVSPFSAICDRFGAPQKTFYAFKAYGDLYRAGKRVLCESEQSAGFAHTGIYADAAISKNGECYIMIASFGGCGVVDLRLDSIPDNLYTADVYMIDGVKDLTLGDSVPISGQKKRLVLNLSEYAVVLVKLY